MGRLRERGKRKQQRGASAGDAPRREGTVEEKRGFELFRQQKHGVFFFFAENDVTDLSIYEVGGRVSP